MAIKAVSMLPPSTREQPLNSDNPPRVKVRCRKARRVESSTRRSISLRASFRIVFVFSTSHCECFMFLLLSGREAWPAAYAARVPPSRDEQPRTPPSRSWPQNEPDAPLHSHL